MNKYLALALLVSLALPAHAGSFAVTSSAAHQPVKAEVTNPDPKNFTINLKKLANLSVNQDAKTYALYTTASVPGTCADFRKDDIDYKKPDKYHRIFDLSKKPEVVEALHEYGCVVVPNKPKLPPAHE
jgi:hypothetical protein